MLTNRILEIVDFVEKDKTRLNKKAILLEGMTSFKVKNLLNKACSYENTKYLEIGVYKGATFYSALCNNDLDYAACIDKFSEFDGSEKVFLENLNEFESKFSFFNQDCFSIDLKTFPVKINTYFYDGRHTVEDQKKALTYFYNILENSFIYICDDYSWESVQEGTWLGIREANFKILDQKILTPEDGYWDGIFIGLLSK